MGSGAVVHNCGTGVGFSVERQYVSLLPVISEDFHDSDTCIMVADSRIGWAKALRELISMLYVGQIPKWDVSKVRPAGQPLKTFGGRASGPDPLVNLFKFCIQTFKNASGRKLQSIECHDIMCKIGEAIVVGGVRRCLFDKYKVRMNDGSWKHIAELVKGEKISFEGQEVTILDVIDNGVQETIEICMEDGAKHICTPEHKWFVYNLDSSECEWVEARNLESGNYSMLELK